MKRRGTRQEDRGEDGYSAFGHDWKCRRIWTVRNAGVQVRVPYPHWRTLLFAYFGVVFAVTWSLWFGSLVAEARLPLFFSLDGDTAGQSFPFYLLQVTAISVVLAWVYKKTGGSLLITMLLHAAINNTKDIVPSAVTGASNPWRLHASLVGWLTLVVLWLCAAWFLFAMRRNTTVARLAEAS